MRIAIVNDMPLAVEALRRAVLKAPNHEVAWIARDGLEAVEKCAADRPDVILMDLIMPKMDGVEATRRIMSASPCAILVVTATVKGNISKVFEAMGHGALDAVNTPVLGQPGGEQPLLEKIAVLGHLLGKTTRTTAATLAPAPPPPRRGEQPFLVALGASTGGPRALVAILGAFPPDSPVATAVIQHVDRHFAPGLAEWLGEQSRRPVTLAREGDRLEPGKVLLAATDDHLVIAPDLTLHYTAEPAACPYRPSVDEFFKSAARHWPGRGTAALLTGMGRDGAAGLLALRQAGWFTVAEARETCIIHGMPKAATELGAAEKVLPLPHIGPALLEAWRRAGASR